MSTVGAVQVSFASHDDLFRAVPVLDGSSNEVDAERLTISVLALHGSASLSRIRDRLRAMGIDVVDLRYTTR